MKIQKRTSMTKVFETVSHALPVQKIGAVIDSLKEAGYSIDEAGSLEDPEGHVVTASKDGAEVFMAILHNINKPYYLVRAMAGLFI